MATGRPLVVWHWLNSEGDLITKWLRKRFKGLRVAEARGGISATKKDKALKEWADGNVDVIVANPGSIGIGIDLIETNVMVFYSNGRSIIKRKQAAKRTHRTGQTRRCLYFDLTCTGTVDEVFLESLAQSEDAFNSLTRDQAWNRLRGQRGL